MSVLDKATSVGVTCQPFPHVVVHHALDDELCRQLLAEFPAFDVITQGQAPGDNARFNYPARKAANDVGVSAAWRATLREHVSQEFLNKLIGLFRESILREYPDIESRFGRLDTWRAGVRGEDDFETADVLLDAQISVNTPVRAKPTSVLGPHVDKEHNLLAGLFYLRDDHDDSRGGDLELFRIRDEQDIKFWNGHTVDEYVQPVARVPYKKNTLVMILNTWKSIHGVTVRSVTPHPRMFMNVVVEMREPLFEITNRRPRPIKRLLKCVNRFMHPKSRAA